MQIKCTIDIEIWIIWFKLDEKMYFFITDQQMKQINILYLHKDSEKGICNYVN